MNLVERADFYAQQYGLDPSLFRRVISQESSWNPKARSRMGAYGLSQVMPDTASNPGFGVRPLTDIENPDEQLRFGAEYLAALTKRYGGDTNKALAAYNWGAGNADNWDGKNLDALPKETRDYITKISGGSTEGPSPGFMTFAGGDYTPPDVSTYGALTIGPPVEPEPEPNKFQSWVREKMPWLSEANNRDKLLAIGTGLLSGDDWASGMGAAGENLLAMRQQEKENNQRQQRAWQEHQWGMQADAARAARGASDVKRYGMGPMQLPDGTIRGDISQGTDGRLYGGDGQPIDPAVAATMVPVNRSIAGGDKAQLTGQQALQQQSTLMIQKQGLETLDRLYDFYAKDPAQGVEKVWQDINKTYRTLVGKGYTPEQIASAVTSGDMQSMVGALREAKVGPGTMTEQDALRVLAAMGGDPSSYLANPDAFKARLEITRKELLDAYDVGYDQYETMRVNNPRLNYIQIPRYEAPAQEGTPSPAPDVTTKVPELSPPPEFDPQVAGFTWDQTSPEFRKAYIEAGAQSGESGQPALDQSNANPPMPDNYPWGQAAWDAAPPEVKKMFIEGQR